jgi:heptosyltransferase-2
MSAWSRRIGFVYQRLVPPGRDLQLLAEPLFRWQGRRRPLARLLDAHRVLVIRPDRIGDVVLSSAFLRELRRSLPAAAHVTLLTRPEVRELVALCPYVDDILTYRWERPWNRSRWQRYRRAWTLARTQLWPRDIELAILPRWDVDQENALVIAYLSGATYRAGYVQQVSLAQAAGGDFSRLLTHAYRQPQIRHEVEHTLEMVRWLGGRVEEDRLELWLGAEDRLWAQAFLAQHGHRRERPLVALAPGTGEAKRNWPLERYTALAVWLQAGLGATVLLIGGPQEQPLAEAIQAALGGSGIVAAGHAGLRQTGALLEHCALYIGGDTGPMHMAAAAGATVVAISCHPRHGSPASPNAPVRFGPWGQGHIVLQPSAALSPCREQCTAREPHCITAVSYERVRDAVLRAWQARPAPVGVWAGGPG